MSISTTLDCQPKNSNGIADELETLCLRKREKAERDKEEREGEREREEIEEARALNEVKDTE